MARWEQAKARVALEVLGIGKFVLEKLLRWTDHVEQNRAGGIILLFDAEEQAPRACVIVRGPHDTELPRFRT